MKTSLAKDVVNDQSSDSVEEVEETLGKHPNAMENWLFNDPKYYAQKIAYVVCAYGNERINEISTKTPYRYFEAQHYQHLLDKTSFVGDEIIDAFCYARMIRKEWKDVAFAPTRDTSCM